MLLSISLLIIVENISINKNIKFKAISLAKSPISKNKVKLKNSISIPITYRHNLSKTFSLSERLERISGGIN